MYSTALINELDGAIDFEYNALINMISSNEKNPTNPITRFDEISPLLQSVNMLLIKLFFVAMTISNLAKLVQKSNFIINIG